MTLFLPRLDGICEDKTPALREDLEYPADTDETRSRRLKTDWTR